MRNHGPFLVYIFVVPRIIAPVSPLSGNLHLVFPAKLMSGYSSSCCCSLVFSYLASFAFSIFFFSISNDHETVYVYLPLLYRQIQLLSVVYLLRNFSFVGTLDFMYFDCRRRPTLPSLLLFFLLSLLFLFLPDFLHLLRKDEQLQ